MLNFNNNSKTQKQNNMINNLGNILGNVNNNNNNNNKNDIKMNPFGNQKTNQMNQNPIEENKKMILTNSSMNFQTQASTNNSGLNNKENYNPQSSQIDPFHKFKNRTSFDLNAFNDNSNNNNSFNNSLNNTLNRANSTFTQNPCQNQIYKLNLNSSNNDMQMTNVNINENQGGQVDNRHLGNNYNNNNNTEANQLFDELNNLYGNNTNTLNSISCITTDKDEKELNRLKENYYNVSNKLKSEQKSFNKEGNNSLVGMLQLLKMEGELRKNIENPSMNINELQEIYKTIVEYGQAMGNKVDYIKTIMNERNEIKGKIKLLNDNNSNVNISSHFDEISQLSGNDFTQFDQEMDLSSH